jgi:hypothetical protein
MSVPGTNRLTVGGQSMSALPRYIRRQLAPLSRARHRPQCPISDGALDLCAPEQEPGRPEDCRRADRALPTSTQ